MGKIKLNRGNLNVPIKNKGKKGYQNKNKGTQRYQPLEGYFFPLLLWLKCKFISLTPLALQDLVYPHSYSPPL